MEFHPTQFDNHSIARYCTLFAECFPKTKRYTFAYLKWMYEHNPEGPAFGFDAYDGEILAAHYVCLPGVARVNGLQINVLLSLNTATKPEYQGKGLFTKLAQMTYQRAANEGFDCIYGVANANSTPGFIRKLGFQLVRPLEARVGFGSIDYVDNLKYEPSFERIWSQAAIEWRCSSPYNPIRAKQKSTTGQFYANAMWPFLSAYGEISLPNLSLANLDKGGPRSPARLFIGILPVERVSYRNYFSVPERLRPSPLNLIYRSLKSAPDQIDPYNIKFSFLDFDAY